MACSSTTILRICPLAFTEGKLDGTNYTIWKFKISTIFYSNELLATIMGLNEEDPESVITRDPANPSVEIQPNDALLRAWKKRNADAMCAIVTSVSDSVLTLIQHTSKAHESWGILARQYETRNHTRIQNLENQLADQRHLNTDKSKDFIKRIKNLQDQMVVVGVVTTPEDLACRCIRILPFKV
ncbi:hypothetical protein L7F22_010811 [Adiantum nelumboides]|nr:hypothetical protein [Adiantum nelumboides]